MTVTIKILVPARVPHKFWPVPNDILYPNNFIHRNEPSHCGGSLSDCSMSSIRNSWTNNQMVSKGKSLRDQWLFLDKVFFHSIFKYSYKFGLQKRVGTYFLDVKVITGYRPLSGEKKNIKYLTPSIKIWKIVACIPKRRKSAAAPRCLQRSTLSTYPVTRWPGIYEGVQHDLWLTEKIVRIDQKWIKRQNEGPPDSFPLKFCRYVDNEPVDDKYIIKAGDSLVFLKFQHHHSGYYKCQAENAVGQTRAFTDIRVEGTSLFFL